MTSTQRFDAFREMHQLRRMTHSPIFGGRVWGGPFEPEAETSVEAWSIPMDVHRNDKQLTVEASLPGFTADDVDVTISPDRVLSVKATRQTEVDHQSDEYLMRERRSGSFQRALRLPSDLDLDQAAVALDNGVLTVALPVAEAAQTRRLSIMDNTVTDHAVKDAA